MTWLNEGDVRDAVHYIENPWRDDPERPNLKRAVKTLEALVEWTNENSDGWPYWPKPSRAASKLQEIIQNSVLSYQGRTGYASDISEHELKQALIPVKAFLTRQKVDHSEVIK